MGPEGATADGGADGTHSGRPGSRRSRLAGAGKQLGIVLEGVDLVEEPALGEALARAVRATERAARLERATPDAGDAAHGEAEVEAGLARNARAGASAESVPGGEEPDRGLVFGASTE